MNKKILAIILTLSILITNSMINVFASNDNLVFEETSTALVLLDKMNTNIDNCDFKDVYSFKKSDLNQLLEYNLILTDNDFLSKIDGNKIVELMIKKHTNTTDESVFEKEALSNVIPIFAKDELHDFRLKYRGSSNQRIIDTRKSLSEDKVCQIPKYMV